MKKAIMILSVIAACMASSRANAQSDESQSDESQNNGTFEILNIYLPDSIVFKVAEGKELKEVHVYLVSGTKSIRGGKVEAKPVHIEMDENGALQATYTDITVIHVMNFDTPKSFEAKKIKFVADGREMYYDLVESKWETGQTNKTKANRKNLKQ